MSTPASLGRRRGDGYVEIAPAWSGETVALLAGGPSLSDEQIELVRSARARVVAINDSYLRAPDADALYFCDERWWEWHHERAEHRAYRGPIFTHENLASIRDPRVLHLKNDGIEGLASERWKVRTGRNSGYQAINVAAHLGVRRILLIGYDMRPVGGRMYWHEGHPVPTAEKIASRTWAPTFPSLVAPLRERGVAVLNCTPNSALECFPRAELAEALRMTEAA